MSMIFFSAAIPSHIATKAYQPQGMEKKGTGTGSFLDKIKRTIFPEKSKTEPAKILEFFSSSQEKLWDMPITSRLSEAQHLKTRLEEEACTRSFRHAFRKDPTLEERYLLLHMLLNEAASYCTPSREPSDLSLTPSMEFFISDAWNLQGDLSLGLDGSTMYPDPSVMDESSDSER